VVPPDPPPCEIEGADGAGDGSAGLTFCLSVAFGSLWSELRAAWTWPGTAGEFTFPEQTIRDNNQQMNIVHILSGSPPCEIEGVDVGGST
jgi:hypothetical protein